MQHGEGPAREVALLFGVALPRGAGSSEESLAELALLAESAGAQVAATVLQTLRAPDPACYVGRGKAVELAELRAALGAQLLICDDELRPVQVRNLEDRTGLRVVDRTQLILDIFAQRAHTREGRLQVELAQLTYLLPRLAGRGAELSRLGGGIGTRGPGETKLERDRRRIRRRIAELKAASEEVRRTRGLHRQGRRRSLTPLVALVGYTNAGKSTLLNALTGAGAPAADRLFATLDPAVRRAALPGGEPVLVSDTVGFIRKLPHTLVAAFRATLEEVVEADCLVHVVDASHPEGQAQEEAVLEVLGELGALDKPLVTAYNKADRLETRAAAALAGRARARGAVVISALRGEGLAELRALLAARLPEPLVRCSLRIPYGEAAVLDRLHRQGRVLHEGYDAGGILVEAEIRRPLAAELGAYRVREVSRA